jgi:hypothetical protein
VADQNKDALAKFQVYQRVNGTGTIGLQRYFVKAESAVRVSLDSNATGSTIEIYGSITDGPFELVGSVSGNTSEVFDFSTYDNIKFICSTFAFSFDLYASGFYPVSPLTNPLPPGASTEAKQDDIIDAINTLSSTITNGFLVSGSASSVAAATETTIVSYTVPALDDFALGVAYASADGDCIFRLKKNGSTIGVRRNNWCERQAEWRYGSLLFSAGDVISVTAIHNCSNTLNIEAEIYGN